MRNDLKIQRLVTSFRRHIELAKKGRLFQGDLFDNFPDECCADTSYMLAEFLLENNIETIVVSGENSKRETHAWLVVKDERVIIPEKEFFDDSEYIKKIWNLYRACEDSTPIDITHYEQRNIENGLIIDITADQFGEAPIYVGLANPFYESFEFHLATEFNGLSDERLIRLYNRIIK